MLSSDRDFKTDEIFCDFKNYLQDECIDELLINGDHGAWLKCGDKLTAVNNPFSSKMELLDWVQTLALSQRLRLDPLFPANGGMIDGCLRWHCLLPPLAIDGPIFSLRKHRFAEISLEQFSIPNELLDKICSAYLKRYSLLICGSTGSGKTTFLSALLKKFSQNERVVTIETLQELPLLSPLWVRMVERQENVEGKGFFGVNKLFLEALRLRPERFVIGEIRNQEWPVFIQAILSGHQGALATIHAGSIDQLKIKITPLLREQCSEINSITLDQALTDFKLCFVLISQKQIIDVQTFS